MLTDRHKALIRSTLSHRTEDSAISPEQRLAIREICVERMPITKPDAFLRAFVDALVDAANAEGMPYGAERDTLLSQLVSAFVDELRATTDEEVALESGARRVTPTSVARLVLDSESGSTP
jgi:hypothetical protein